MTPPDPPHESRESSSWMRLARFAVTLAALLPEPPAAAQECTVATPWFCRPMDTLTDDPIAPLEADGGESREEHAARLRRFDELQASGVSPTEAAVLLATERTIAAHAALRDNDAEEAAALEAAVLIDSAR